jgi:hypothetical protein
VRFDVSTRNTDTDCSAKDIKKFIALVSKDIMEKYIIDYPVGIT